MVSQEMKFDLLFRYGLNHNQGLEIVVGKFSLLKKEYHIQYQQTRNNGVPIGSLTNTK